MTRRRISVLVLLLALAGCVGSSVNNPTVALLPDAATDTPVLPTISVADLEGTDYTFPAELPTDYTIAVFGFAHAQRDVMAAWIAQLLEEAIPYPELRVFRIPVIDSSNASLRTVIRNGMRAGTPDSDARRRTLTLFGDKAGFARALKIHDLTKVAVLLFDRAGRVRWRAAGADIDQNIASLRPTLSTLMKQKE
jgi:hypothetical protein